ncbi:unnamed protein product [Chondrus crispus]|uniref:PBS-linker domain-containing protein n=1 Tax=Chondrus crispus TaxID=2769 RepID=R7QQQ6_CHOCR|nr:unnamed protein product [Chondrus crispus]CDF39720.1 unnamed protein product [Chondrus crispus]|eukprot:XP_005710014.1 unnamed protein product [Chondrus crispus]
MNVEFQTYSGGLDRVSIDPYTITRDLFTPLPQNLNPEEKDVATAAGLRQLFGNAYLMEEERAQFYNAESQYRCDQITAKEFLRAAAKSQTYRQRFFDSVSQYRFIELNFKHILGRAPLNQVEYSKHFKIFAAGGFDAEIDSYFDDPEYDDVFGEDVMPYTRFRGTYAPINQFNRMCTIEGGFAGSDKCKPQMLVTSLAANVPTSAFSVVDGLPAIPNSEHQSKKYDLPDASLERFRNELEIAAAKAYQLQIELNEAYEKLSGFRDYANPFKAMAQDMNITQLYGSNYGSGKVSVFAGEYIGAKAGSWGPSGVDNINGPTRRPAVVIGKKEKQLERVKQLIVDLERKVSVLEAEREKPALTPGVSISGFMDMQQQEVAKAQAQSGSSVTMPLPAPVPRVIEVQPAEAENLIVPELVDVEDEESGLVKPQSVQVETKRQIKDVGRLPKELMEEIEEEKKASGQDFLEGKGPREAFPGDGSEMVIGG